MKVAKLGYSISHATGAVLDNPDLIVAAVVGDGEAGNRSVSCFLDVKQVHQPCK